MIATGARPVGLPGPGRQRFLRTIDDALALRETLVPGARLVIIGAGWIGAELATAAAGRGVRRDRRRGGRRAARRTPSAPRWARPPQPGTQRRASSCCSARSSRPCRTTGWRWPAAASWPRTRSSPRSASGRRSAGWSPPPVKLENGVAVDEQLRSSVPGVYAVGDCAAFWSGRFGRRMRTEHWDTALRAPAVLAANLIGGARAVRPRAVLLVRAVRQDAAVRRRSPRR